MQQLNYKIQINESSGAKEQLINESKETNLNTSDKLVILGCLGLSALLGIGIILIATKYN